MSAKARQTDAAIAAAIAAATFAYLWLWPRDFFAFDEGLYLYESRRLLEGGVFYRDFLEIITPGAFYYLGLLFRLFGVTLLTAKMGNAAVHAAIAVWTFAICRRLGVRRSLAVAAAAAHVAIDFPAMASASPHWVGSALTLLAIYLCIALSWRHPSSSRLLGLGAAVGALVMVQQQKGVVIAAGVAAVLAADYALAGASRPRGVSVLARRVALFVAGIAAVAVPATLALLAQAGFAPMWESLIYFPFRNYPGFGQCRSWGFSGAMAAHSPLAWIVPALPFAAALLPVRFAWSALARKDAAAARPAIALYLLLAASGLSVYYCPNYTHLVLIAPVGFIAVAEIVESAVSLAGDFRWMSVAATAAALFGIIGFGNMARVSLARREAMYPFTQESRVGPVRFRNEDEVTLLEAMLERTRPGDEIFAYPSYPGIYFLTGTVNPTRFQILLSDYHEPKHFQEAIDVIESRRVPLVVVQAIRVAWKKDPIAAYLARDYKRAQLPFRPSDAAPGEKKKLRIFSFAVFERRAP